MKIILLIGGYLLLQFTLSPSFAIEGGEIFKDWKTQCTDNNADKNVLGCHIFQNLVSRDGEHRVLHIAIGYVRGRNDPAAIITLPLGIALPPGINVSVDGKNPKKFPYQACFKTGCQAGFPVDSEMLSSFRSGNKAIIKIYDLSHEPIDIPVSLSGFSAAINAINPRK